MEANIQVMEGTQYRLRVKLTNKAGEQLPPELFRVYAGAFCPGCAPAHFHAERTAEEWVLTMPGLKPGRAPWNWQVIAAEYATGVEWLLAAGEVNVTARHARGSGYVDPGELKIVATLDKTTLQMTVQLGDSSAACSLAVVDARNSAKEADASAKLAAGSSDYAAEQAQAAETARQQADGYATTAATHAADAHRSATAADTSAKQADAAATNAANQATLATEQATSATTARTQADAAAKDARAHAADAQTSSKASADSASESIEAAEKAEAASATGADQAARAEGFAEAAGVARAGAEAAQAEAEAARVNADAAAGNAAASAESAANSVEQAEWALPADYMRFSHVTSFTELGECATDLLDTEVWKYPLNSLTNAIGCTMEQVFPNLRKVLFFSEALNNVVWASEGRFINKSLDELRIVLPNAVQLQYFAGNASCKAKIPKIWLYAPKATYLGGYFINMFGSKEVWVSYAGTSIVEWTLGGHSVTVLRYLGNKLESISLSCMSNLKEIHCGFPLATKINFQKAKLDKASVLRVVNSLQSYDASTMSAVPTLTLGIDPALNGDEEINAALLNAQEAVENGGKGWNVAVSGYTITAGTGAATMGLRRLVYVTREAAADGGYVDAAGQRWAVRWGDTVLQNGLVNEELGYEAFPSVEAALDEWWLRELTMEEAMAALAEELKQ